MVVSCGGRVGRMAHGCEGWVWVWVGGFGGICMVVCALAGVCVSVWYLIF